MYFGKTTILCLLVVCLAINAVAVKRRQMKTKIKKGSIPKIVTQPCSCKKPALLDIIHGGCRSPIIEQALGPLASLEYAIPASPSPIIDIPNYRYADPIELNPLGCLFPTLELPSLISPQVMVPSVEYVTAVDLPCGCPGPNCGCRAPAVKLPAYPREILGIDVPNCGCQGLPPYSVGPVASLIELPSYLPSPVLPVSLAPACGCQGPCSCPEIQILSCGCQGSCSCPGIPISSCGCQGPCSCPSLSISPCGCAGPCSCPEIQVLSCGCQGSCSCPAIPISPCGCQGPCSCSAIPISPCGCAGPCSCPEIQVLSCGCQGACSCPGIPISSCGCQGSCGCGGIQVGLLPTVDVPPCPCGCGIPGCECSKYLRQVTLQPPFL